MRSTPILSLKGKGMKKTLSKIITVLILTVTAALTLASCDDTPPPVAENKDAEYLYYGDVIPSVVYGEGVPKEVSNLIYSSLRDRFGMPPEYSYGASESARHEIVIGMTDMSISKKAYRKLRLAERRNEYDVAYVIYASGSSVAIAYDEGVSGFAATAAIEHLMTNIIGDNSELKLTSGVVESNTVSTLDYYAEIDAENKEIAWKKLSDYLGAETGEPIVTAMKKLYSIYDDGVVTWFPNLYDPAVGGYYFSNSARDKTGFLPDIESTSQALGFIDGSGMLYNTDKAGYASVLSDEIKAQIIRFLRSLQDPNGYFYHPQWSKADTDAHLSRRARDLGRAVGVLVDLGSGPVYDTPNGDKGDYIIPTSSVTVPLGTSAASLASRAVYAAASDTRFENLDTLRAYLDSMLAAGRTFYDIGNELTSQMTEVVTRDKELGTWGTEDSLAHCIVEWLNAHQYPETGHWEPTAGYAGVNSLLKISGVYNAACEPIPNALAAATSAMNAITSDEPMGGIVDIYNTWYAVGNVIKNLRQFGGSAADADAILADLRAKAPVGLEATMEKLLLYKRDDGSFSYYQDRYCTQSQGMTVCAPDMMEGDVNATVIATNSILSVIYYALDVSGYIVPIFGQRELCIYLTTLESLGPVQKTDEDTADTPVYVDFEESILGEAPDGVTSKFSSQGTLTTVDVGGDRGNVASYKTVAGGGDYLYLTNGGSIMGSCYVFETDIRFLSEGKNDYTYCYQIFMDSAYLMLATQSGGKMVLSDMTTSSAQTAITEQVATLDFDTWYNLRIEYYTGDASTVRIKVYINGSLVSVSDNYYGKLPDVKPAPYASGCKTLSFYAMGSAQMTVELDNMYYGTSSTTYTPATAEDTDVVYNVDAQK